MSHTMLKYTTQSCNFLFISLRYFIELFVCNQLSNLLGISSKKLHATLGTFRRPNVLREYLLKYSNTRSKTFTTSSLRYIFCLLQVSRFVTSQKDNYNKNSKLTCSKHSFKSIYESELP